MIKKMVFFLILFLVFSLQAEIIVKQDKNGKIIVSNRASKNPLKKDVKFRNFSGSSLIPPTYLTKIKRLSKKFQLREDLIIGVARAESSFNPYAVSRKGAVGIMQLMQETALQYGVTNRFNIDQNLEGGIKHLRYLYKKYQKNIPLTLAAYNAGEEAVKKYRGVPPYPETKNFIRKVMKFMGMRYSKSTNTKIKKKLYMYTTKTGKVIITDSLPSKIEGKIEVLE